MGHPRRVVIRPPPGARFITYASPNGGDADLYLEYEGGKEKEVVNWFYNWCESYIIPNMEFNQKIAEQNAAKQDTLKAASETAKEIIAEVEQKQLPFKE